MSATSTSFSASYDPFADLNDAKVDDGNEEYANPDFDSEFDTLNMISFSPASPNPSDSGSADSEEDDRFAIAKKAERLLGLKRGSLAQAKACVQIAREQATRLAAAEPAQICPLFIERERDAYHMALAMEVNPIVGFGAESERNRLGQHRRQPRAYLRPESEEELMRMNRLRKAADAVLYWEREVARLEIVEGYGPGPAMEQTTGAPSTLRGRMFA
jgi:hypothetical protein